jgi:D-alanyl-D-alanine carboxypeptidase
MFFVPWLSVKAWILPLPDTVQEQIDEAIGHGFDGMIVYVDQAGHLTYTRPLGFIMNN